MCKPKQKAIISSGILRDWHYRASINGTTSVVKCVTLPVAVFSARLSNVVHARCNATADRMGEGEPASPRRTYAPGVRRTAPDCRQLPAKGTARPHSSANSGCTRSLYSTRQTEEPYLGGP